MYQSNLGLLLLRTPPHQEVHDAQAQAGGVYVSKQRLDIPIPKDVE